jgi:hypothetical protein
MMMLQFENIFVIAIFVQFNARLLGRQSGLGHLLLMCECCAGAGLGNPDAGQPRFLENRKK